jgi:hypothetical protein
MHIFNQVLWTLTFAAHLTLMVVLIGRERLRRFPCFAAAIVLYALRLLAEVMLMGRLPMIPYRVAIVFFALMTPLVGLLVAVELARRAFAKAPARGWRIAAPIALVLAAAVTFFWGQWPIFHGFSWQNLFAMLSLLQFTAQKLDHFYDVLIIEAALLILFFGARYGAGWRSHARRVAVGVATVALAWIAIQASWLTVVANARPRTQQEYEQLVNLGAILGDLQKCIYLAATLWWIYSLWKQEPESAPAIAASSAEPAPAVDVTGEGAETSESIAASESSPDPGANA